MPIEIRTFGTIEPSVSVTIKSQISGILTNINFKEGQDVRKNDILFAIDSTPMENDLKQTKANLARDRIQQANAMKEAQRQDELLKKGLTSQDAYDQAKTTAEALASTVKAEEAAVENTKVQLGYCTIRSPIHGRTGKYLVDEGNLVLANETILNTINQIKPIEASFTVPEQHLGEICRQMASGKLEVKIFLPDEPDKPETGILTFMDNTVDRSTGTINLKATFHNDNSRLWPGQFVTISVILSVQQWHLVVLKV
jgi:multidrug efflux system membrane fusion protein